MAGCAGNVSFSSCVSSSSGCSSCAPKSASYHHRHNSLSKKLRYNSKPLKDERFPLYCFSCFRPACAAASGIGPSSLCWHDDQNDRGLKHRDGGDEDQRGSTFSVHAAGRPRSGTIVIANDKPSRSPKRVITAVIRAWSCVICLPLIIQADTAIVAVVDRFYERLLSKGSPVEKYFAGHDHTKLRNHQIAFITFAFGGPSRYTGRSMNASHARRAPRTRASSPACAGYPHGYPLD